jgi:hypothetical protein
MDGPKAGVTTADGIDRARYVQSFRALRRAGHAVSPVPTSIMLLLRSRRGGPLPAMTAFRMIMSGITGRPGCCTSLDLCPPARVAVFARGLS